jgi:ATP-dependent DNA ligase
MDLPVLPPVKPMLAASVDKIPSGMRYEPKWDGFRTIVFRDGDEIELGSRTGKPLTRYFPELVEALRTALPKRCVVDGETILPIDGVLDFEALLQRVHPADSRVRKLSVETPVEFVAFDVLAVGDENLMDLPLSERVRRLPGVVTAGSSVHLTPYTEDEQIAAAWFNSFEGAGLDGLVAKPFDILYVPDKRLMRKIKHQRTADCVVAGYRVHKSGSGVGSLLLGLFDDAGVLQHVGVVGAFSMARRRELEEELQPLRLADGDSHPWLDSPAEGDRVPGGQPSRWQQGKDLSFVPLDPSVVIEVAYDHMEGTRFRHTTQLVRFRPDREPRSCTYEQLERPVSFDLDAVLAGKGP